MIAVPAHIQALRNYQPGKPIEDIIREFGLNETAILWNNENNLGASPKALQAVEDELKTSNLYSDPGAVKLRTAIARHIGRQRENIVVGNGSEGLLMNILKAFCSGTDELLTSAGSFVIIYIWANIQGIQVKTVPLTTQYAFDLDAIYQAINPQTKVIYLCNANNPTGAAIPEKELKAFLAKVPKHILVIIDEAYFEFSKAIDPHFPDSSTYTGYENIISLRTFSKAYGIAGIRIGYGIAPKEITEVLMKVKLTFEPSNLAQAAGIGALRDDVFLQKTLNNNREGLNYFYEEFNKMGLNFVQSYANFVMIDMASAENAELLCTKLMQKGVFIRQLTAFGLPHCVRISVGRMEENRLCVEKMRSEY